MCHQTVGLIAHQLEEAGIATTSISTAKDITEAARMPRSVFLDFPHGYTAGKVANTRLAIDIIKAALDLIDAVDEETLKILPYRWGNNDSWKDSVFQIPERESATTDLRLERSDSPQYQTTQDREYAIESHDGEDCMICSGIDY